MVEIHPSVILIISTLSSTYFSFKIYQKDHVSNFFFQIRPNFKIANMQLYNRSVTTILWKIGVGSGMQI